MLPADPAQLRGKGRLQARPAIPGRRPRRGHPAKAYLAGQVISPDGPAIPDPVIDAFTRPLQGRGGQLVLVREVVPMEPIDQPDSSATSASLVPVAHR